MPSPSGDGGPGPAQGLEVAGEALDVAPAHAEERQALFCAPSGELAQVKGVGVSGQARVATQEPSQGQGLDVGEQLIRAGQASRR